MNRTILMCVFFILILVGVVLASKLFFTGDDSTVPPSGTYGIISAKCYPDGRGDFEVVRCGTGETFSFNSVYLTLVNTPLVSPCAVYESGEEAYLVVPEPPKARGILKACGQCEGYELASYNKPKTVKDWNDYVDQVHASCVEVGLAERPVGEKGTKILEDIYFSRTDRCENLFTGDQLNKWKQLHGCFKEDLSSNLFRLQCRYSPAAGINGIPVELRDVEDEKRLKESVQNIR